MRRLLSAAFLLFTIASAAPDFVVDFTQPQAGTPAVDNDTIADDGSLELVKRQNNCRNGYSPCINLNAPGLCCEIGDVCSRDAANNVACCPANSACTGTIRPVVPTGTPTSASSFVAGTTQTTSSFVLATTTTGTSNSFVQSSAAGSYVRSMVPNTFYPFPYIPTTYINAAACSQAYTSCQADAMSCTSALANGVPGVTVSAPNGGATITAIASLGPERAAAVCASLSSQACSGLIVEACARFGDGAGSAGGARTLCGGMYGVGAGVAVGIAGQLLR
ncbi:uncharacterized protein EI97DRAFT_468733 [Westerdykella ornata]|uniref:GPI anchored protein n=1 Tax=Westerdykella ornata TaxID=318751 RepID=A0A6A6JE62_WESOR|nr:uncharacterized protein EI97DRAFT_468733 [Westerdykella ornata]KAF2274555.1 hypothetical protein EI97DRAFT_468733 [Westerdykella ornata]